MGCQVLLRGVFPTPGLSPGFLHYRQIFFFFSSKNLCLLFARDRLLQAPGPDDFQKGWGRVEDPPCLPGAARPTLLPAGDGRAMKCTLAPAATASTSCVSCSVVSGSATPWTVARPAPLSKGFFRQEYWSGLPFPSPTGRLFTV